MGAGGGGGTVLKTDGTKYLKFEKQANLLVYSFPLLYITVTKNLTDTWITTKSSLLLFESDIQMIDLGVSL